jgi:LuxR family maltose regulon positive regulatory protein
MVTAIALRRLAQLRVMQGRLSEAKAFCEQALELSVDGRGRRLPIAGLVLIVLGELLREWNDLEAAARHLIEGIELVKQWGEIGAFDGYVALAHVRQAQGDVDGAREAIHRAQQLAIQFDASEVDDVFVALHQARLWVAQGNLEAAIRWAEGRQVDRDVDSEEESSHHYPLVRALEHLTLARVYIAWGRPEEALEMLESLLQTAEAAGWMGYVIEILALQALALQGQGDILPAVTALERALSLAEPEGYVRIFVDEGEPMAELLRHAASRGIAPTYVAKLLAAFEVEGLAVSPSNLQPLIEPLSERELEVLRLLTTHLSSTEIADELVISVNTVRSHIKSIYSKLNVHSRMDAVQRAKELELL